MATAVASGSTRMGGRVSVIRPLAGGAGLMLFFAGLSVTYYTDPGSGLNSAPDQLKALAENQGASQLTGILALVTVAALTACVMGFTGMTRGRGAALGNVGAALGVAGLIGMSTGALHFYIGAATAAIGPEQGAIFDARLADLLGPVVFPLFFAAPLAFAFFAAALWRAGATSWKPFALVCLFNVIPWIEPVLPFALPHDVELAIGLIAVGWAYWGGLKSVIYTKR